MIYLASGIVILVALMWYLDKKGLTRVKMIFSIAIVVVIAGYMGYVVLVPPAVTIENGNMVITGSYGVEIPLSEITSVELTSEIPKIELRSNGIDAFGYALIGKFRLAEWGNGRLFMQQKTGPFVVVKYHDTFSIINYRDQQRSQETYDLLYSAWSK